MADTSAAKLSRLEQQQKELAEKIRQEKAKLRKEEQAREDKRKRILGGLVMAHYKDQTDIRNWVESLLQDKLTRPDERVLFGLEPKDEPSATS